MFITRGPMPTARVWREWFGHAGLVELVPGSAVNAFLPRVPSPTSSAAIAAAAVAAAGHTDVHTSGGSGGASSGEASSGGDGGGSRSFGQPDDSVPSAMDSTSTPAPPGSDARRKRQLMHVGGAAGPQGVLDPVAAAGGAPPGAAGGGAREGACSDLQAAPAAGGDVVSRQRLFSVYVHVGVEYAYCPGDLFYGHELPAQQRVPIHWGQHTMVDAERALIAAALADLTNQRFVMLSESCLPLYPPHVVWLQLMWERQSRVNACKGDADWAKRGEDR